MNASLGIHTVISNGEVVSDHDASNYKLPDAAVYLALKADRTLADYQANLATGPNMLADGATQAWLAFYKIIDNNNYCDWSWIDAQWADEGSNIATSRNPRQCIGQKNDKTIVILTTDGRRTGEFGLTSEESAIILHDEGCTNAWNLDGGGSTSTVIKGYKINSNIDDHFTTDRKINACLNIKNTITNEELSNAYSQIGNVTQLNNNKLMGVISQAIVSSYANGSVDDLVNQQGLWYGVGLTDAPNTSGYIMTIPNTLADNMGLWAGQVFLNRENGRSYTRIIKNGIFSEWRPTEGYIAHLYSRSSNYYEVTADDTYEKVTFDNNIIYSNVSGFKDDLLTIDENNGLVITGDMTTATLEITLDLTTTGVAGQRYIQLKSGNNVISNSVSRFIPSGALSATTHTITALTTIADPITIEVYGKAGDRVSRIKAIVRSFS